MPSKKPAASAKRQSVSDKVVKTQLTASLKEIKQLNAELKKTAAHTKKLVAQASVDGYNKGVEAVLDKLKKFSVPKKKKGAIKEPTAKKATAKKVTAKKATAKKTTAKEVTAKKATAKKATAKKATAKKATAKKATAKKVTAKKATANKPAVK